MATRFTDRLVLVTGASGGMGRAFAQAFASEGARLILTDLEPKGLEETAGLIRANGTQCSTHIVNLAVERDIQQFAEQVRGAHPRLDVLINNAGLAYGEIAHGFAQLSQEKWLHYFNVNTVSPLLLGQALRPLLASARGVVLNVSSMASAVPGTAYGVTKAALNAMTYGMAQAFGADGIRVNAIAPGMMKVDKHRPDVDERTWANLAERTPMRRVGSGADLRGAVVFLASAASDFITGHVLVVDGGWTAW